MKRFVELVIFDCDGVIIDSGADIVNAVQNTLAYFNQPLLSGNEIIGYVGHGADELIKKCFPKFSSEQIENALNYYKEYYSANAICKTRLYSHVEETLALLKKMNKKIALVTNKSEDTALKILTVMHIKPYFDMIVGPESVHCKPDPEGILKVLADLRADNTQTIMVGDSYVDVQAGKSGKVLTCGVTSGLGRLDELAASAPDFFISDLSQLLNYIE